MSEQTVPCVACENPLSPSMNFCNLCGARNGPKEEPSVPDKPKMPSKPKMPAKPKISDIPKSKLRSSGKRARALEGDADADADVEVGAQEAPPPLAPKPAMPAKPNIAPKPAMPARPNIALKKPRGTAKVNVKAARADASPEEPAGAPAAEPQAQPEASAWVRKEHAVANTANSSSQSQPATAPLLEETKPADAVPPVVINEHPVVDNTAPSSSSSSGKQKMAGKAKARKLLERLKSPRPGGGKPRKFGFGKKKPAPVEAPVPLPVSGGSLVIERRDSLSAFGIPLSTVGRAAGKKASRSSRRLSVNLSAKKEEEEGPIPGVRLRALEGDCLSCENCTRMFNSDILPFECYLCQRVTCNSCSKNNLCNLCAPKDSWKGHSVAAQKMLQTAENLLKRGEVQSAINNFTQVIVANPTESRCYYGRGCAYQAMSELQLSVRDYTVAIELNGHLPSLSRRMMLYLAEGENDWAIADAETILNFASGSAMEDVSTTLLPRILASNVTLGPQEGILEADAALSVTSGELRAKILIERAQLQLRLRAWGAALTDAHQALRMTNSQPLRARAYLSMAQALQGEGRYLDSLALYEECVRLNGGEAAELGVAVVEYLLGKHQASSENIKSVPYARKQVALSDWIEVLTENSRDHYAGCSACALLKADPGLWSIVPEDRVSSLKRVFKLMLIKQGIVDESSFVHHPSHVLVKVLVEYSQELLYVRVPPQSTVSSLVELLLLMVHPDVADSGGQLFDPFVGAWLEPYDSLITYQGIIHYKQRSAVTSDSAMELHIQDMTRTGIPASFVLDSSCTVLDLLYMVAERWGYSLYGYGFKEPKSRHWLLPSMTIAKCKLKFPRNLEFHRVPSAAAMLTKSSLHFNPLSDCGFELTDEGAVMAWGSALGNFGMHPSDVRIQVDALKDDYVEALSAGLNHITVITSQRQVRVVGSSLKESHLEVPEELQGNVMGVASGFNFSAGVTSNGNVYVWGTAQICQPVELPEPAIGVVCGYAFCVVIGVSGRIFSWGDESTLGRPSPFGEGPQPLAGGLAETQIASVACGIHHGMALTVDGRLFGWGVNNASQVNPNQSGLVTDDKNAKGMFLTPIEVRSGVPAVNSSVMCGEFHSALVICSTATESFGCTIEHAIEVTSISIWGDNKNGVLGIADASSISSEISKFSGTVVKVSCGKAYMMYDLEHSELMAWGKAPHTIMKSSNKPISVWKHWMSDNLSKSRFEEARLGAEYDYSLRYPLKDFTGSISLAGQALMWLPADLQMLPGVTELDLTGNLLECLPFSIRNFPNLRSIKMLGNPAVSSGVLPETVVNSGVRAIIARLRHLDASRIPWKQAKVALLGARGAGKSSLVSQIRKACGASDRPDVSDSALQVSEVAYKDVTMSLYDHSGRPECSTMHHSFMSYTCVYLIVANMTDSTSIEYARYWFDVVNNCVGGVPTPACIFVGTHASDESQCQKLRCELEELDPPFYSLHFLDSSAGSSVAEVLEDILAAAPIGQIVKKSYDMLYSSVKQLSYSRPTIDWSEFVWLAETCLLDGDASVEAARFLHECGCLLYLPQQLPDIVILSPAWLAQTIFNAVDGAEELSEEVIGLMESLDLILIKDEELLTTWQLPHQSSSETTEMMEFAQFQHQTVYDGLEIAPPEFYLRLISRIARREDFWRILDVWTSGIVVQAEEETGWIVIHEDHLQVVTYVPALTYAASTSSEMFPQLVELVDTAVSSFFSADVTMCISRRTACPDCKPQSREYVSLITLVGAWSVGHSSVQCGKGHTLDLRAMAPELGPRFVPRVTDVDLLDETNGKMGEHVVALFELDVGRVRKYGRHDPLQDLFLLSNVNHPNIARAFGIHTPALPSYKAVVQFGGSHDLAQLMQREQNGLTGDRLPVKLQLRILRDVAEGLRFLHTVPLLHRHVRPDNILILSIDPSAPTVARIFCPVDAMDEIDSFRWQSPEVIQGQRRSVASDLYAFAIVCSELACAGYNGVYQAPFGDADAEWKKEQTIEQILEKNSRPALPAECSEEFCAMTRKAWSTDPESRGTFAEVIDTLQGLFPFDAQNVDAYNPPQVASVLMSSSSSDAQKKKYSAQSKVLVDLPSPPAALAVHGAHLWVSTDKPSVNVVDLAEGNVVKRFVATSVDVPCMISFLASIGEYVWGGAQDGTLFVWRLSKASLQTQPVQKEKSGLFKKKSKKKKEQPIDDESGLALELVMVTRVHSNAITEIKGEGSTVYTGDLAHCLVEWSVADGEIKKVSQVQFDQPVRSVAIARDCLFVGLTSEVHVLDKDISKPEISYWDAHEMVDGISQLMMLGPELWTAGKKSVKVWSAESHELINEIKSASTSKVIDLLLLRDHERALVCTAAVDGVITLWDPVTLQKMQDIRDEQGEMLQGKSGTMMKAICAIGFKEVATTRNHQILLHTVC